MQPDKNIDKLFRENRQQFDKMPDERVWERLQQRLDNKDDESTPLIVTPNKQWRYFAAVAIMLLLIAPIGLFMMNRLEQKETVAINTTHNEKPNNTTTSSPSPDVEGVGEEAESAATINKYDAANGESEGMRAAKPESSAEKIHEFSPRKAPKSAPPPPVVGNASPSGAGAMPPPEAEMDDFVENSNGKETIPNNKKYEMVIKENKGGEVEMDGLPKDMVFESKKETQHPNLGETERAKQSGKVIYNTNASYLASNDINMSRYYNAKAKSAHIVPPQPTAPSAMEYNAKDYDAGDEAVPASSQVAKEAESLESKAQSIQHKTKKREKTQNAKCPRLTMTVTATTRNTPPNQAPI